MSTMCCLLPVTDADVLTVETAAMVTAAMAINITVAAAFGFGSSRIVIKPAKTRHSRFLGFCSQYVYQPKVKKC